MATFAVTLTNGPQWDPTLGRREQNGWQAHAAFMDGLVTAGVIVIGGPVGNGPRTLHAVVASDEEKIRTLLAEDPWAATGQLVIAGIEPWAWWLDGRSH